MSPSHPTRPTSGPTPSPAAPTAPTPIPTTTPAASQGPQPPRRPSAARRVHAKRAAHDAALREVPLWFRLICWVVNVDAVQAYLEDSAHHRRRYRSRFGFAVMTVVVAFLSTLHVAAPLVDSTAGALAVAAAVAWAVLNLDGYLYNVLAPGDARRRPLALVPRVVLSVAMSTVFSAALVAVVTREGLSHQVEARLLALHDGVHGPRLEALDADNARRRVARAEIEAGVARAKASADSAERVMIAERNGEIAGRPAARGASYREDRAAWLDRRAAWERARREAAPRLQALDDESARAAKEREELGAARVRALAAPVTLDVEAEAMAAYAAARPVVAVVLAVFVVIGLTLDLSPLLSKLADRPLAYDVAVEVALRRRRLRLRHRLLADLEALGALRALAEAEGPRAGGLRLRRP